MIRKDLKKPLRESDTLFNVKVRHYKESEQNYGYQILQSTFNGSTGTY